VIFADLEGALYRASLDWAILFLWGYR